MHIFLDIPQGFSLKEALHFTRCSLQTKYVLVHVPALQFGDAVSRCYVTTSVLCSILESFTQLMQL